MFFFVWELFFFRDLHFFLEIFTSIFGNDDKNGFKCLQFMDTQKYMVGLRALNPYRTWLSIRIEYKSGQIRMNLIINWNHL